MGSFQQKEGRKEGRGRKGIPKTLGPQSPLGEACWMERSGTESAAPGLWTSVKQMDFISIISNGDAYPHISSWVSWTVAVIQSLSCVWLFGTPWTTAHQAPLSMGVLQQRIWCELPCPPPGDLPNLGIEHGSPALQQAGSLPSEPPGKPTRREGSANTHELQSLRLQCLGNRRDMPNSAGEVKVRDQMETFALILNAWEDMGVGEGKPGGFPSTVTLLWLYSGIISISLEAPQRRWCEGRGEEGWSLSGYWQVSKNNGSFSQYVLFVATRGQRERSFQVPPCLLATPSPLLG